MEIIAIAVLVVLVLVLVVSNIQVATDNNGLLLIQMLQICGKCGFPFHTMVDSGKLPLRIGRIAGNKIKRRVLQCDYAAFIIQFFYADSV